MEKNFTTPLYTYRSIVLLNIPVGIYLLVHYTEEPFTLLLLATLAMSIVLKGGAYTKLSIKNNIVQIKGFLSHFNRKKTSIPLTDISSVRVGRAFPLNLNGVQVPCDVLVFYTKHDYDKNPLSIDGKTRLYYRNFSKKAQEEILRFFEEKKLLKTRDCFHYSK